VKLFRDIHGREIRLTSERIQHIETNHPEMANQTDKIKETLLKTSLVANRFFSEQQKLFQNPWIGKDPQKSRLMVRVVVGYFVISYIIIAFIPMLSIPLVIGGVLLVIIRWMQKNESYTPVKSGQRREYWTRLDLRQKFTLVFVFIIVPVLGLLTPKYLSLYLAFIMSFLFLAFLIVRGNVKNKSLGFIIVNPILMILLMILPVLGMYGQKIIQIVGIFSSLNFHSV